MTQGLEANLSGSVLESMVKGVLKPRGFHFRQYAESLGNRDMFHSRVVECNAPYLSLYGEESRSEFLIYDGSRVIRSECRWQESSGSVDEKFPFLVWSLKRAPEPEALILYGGGGARKCAIQWAKTEAKSITTKTIHVLHIEEFQTWARHEFPMRLAAVA